MKRFHQISLQLHAVSGPGQWFGQRDWVAWQPLVDIYEEADRITVVAELPGIDRDQVRVAAETGVLRISGVRPKKIPIDTTRVHQMEIPYGPFERAIDLPAGSDIDHIEADYDQGYLTVRIPRKVK